jgi:HD-like signal output (HDOD) protein
MSVKRVLFVDNRRFGSENLDRIINGLPEDWQSETVDDGSQALEAMQKSGYDAVAAEGQLPDMGGVELLRRVSELYPGTVRLILSSRPDREQVILGAGHVHQFILKPCVPARFNAILNNALTLRRILSNDRLEARIAEIGALPSPPEVYNQLVRELQSETASVQKIADLIKRDMSITAKLLQVVNSAFFGLSTTVNNPLQAVKILGLDTVKSLVLATGIFNQFPKAKSAEYSIEKIFDQSIAVGASARLFATALGLDGRVNEDSLLGGMLHDIGKLVMLARFPEELDQAGRIAREKSIPDYMAQKEILGVSDAEIGAYLLSLWGLPDSILQAVAMHYEPRQTPHPMPNVLTCVHLAYAFDRNNADNIDLKDDTRLDMEYLEKLNLVDQVEDLYNLCLGAVS